MLEIRRRGSYRVLGNAWSMGHMVARAKRLKTHGKPFEYYNNSLKEVAENEPLTSIFPQSNAERSICMEVGVSGVINSPQSMVSKRDALFESRR